MRKKEPTLFHNKRNINLKPKPKEIPLPPPPRAPKPRPGPTTTTTSSTSPQKVKVIEDDEKTKLPEGPYQEFKLMSCDRFGWKYDIMKFDSRRVVDVNTWQKPVKLNRKELKRDTAADIVGPAAPVAVGPMLGPDGKPVIGADGRIVMVDAEGKPIHATQNGGGPSGSKPKLDKAAEDKKKKKFQKKTRQVFLVPEEVRKLRKEERYPWVMEDAAGKETWVGMMEEVSKSETHALFMPAAENVFKFVPAHRWYKFQKRPSHLIPTLEEAEKLMAQMQKNKDPERWLLHRRNGQGPSAATAAMFKAEAEGRVVISSNSLVHTAGQSLGPGGRRLKTVDTGMRGLFEEDDEEGVDNKRRREREYGGEGDLDEMEYEEDFADDEEKVEGDAADDEEARELEERLKREYKNANKTREGYIDEDEEDEDDQLTGAGKAMKKLVRNLEKNNAYDSDEDENPYASSVEEEEEEPQAPLETGVRPQPAPKQASPSPSAQPSGTDPLKSTPGLTPGTPRIQPSSAAGSRANSPSPTSPASPTSPTSPLPTSHGGHAVVAKRATSPKAPKPKHPLSTAGSRASSPLAQGAPGSRASSPLAQGTPGATRATSPSNLSISHGAPKPNLKRKAEDGATSPTSPTTNGASGSSPAATSSSQPKLKKRKGTPAPGGPTTVDLENLVDWLRSHPNATTKDCIRHFQAALKEEEQKKNFTALVQQAAQLKQGILVLKSQYRLPTPAGSPQAST